MKSGGGFSPLWGSESPSLAGRARLLQFYSWELGDRWEGESWDGADCSRKPGAELHQGLRRASTVLGTWAGREKPERLTLEAGKDERGASEGRDGGSCVGWREGPTNTSVDKGRPRGPTPHGGSLGEKEPSACAGPT